MTNRLQSFAMVFVAAGLALGCGSSNPAPETAPNLPPAVEDDGDDPSAMEQETPSSPTYGQSYGEPTDADEPAGVDDDRGPETGTNPAIPQPADDSAAMADAEEAIVATAELRPIGKKGASGKVKLVQRGEVVTITGKIEGLRPGQHGVHVLDAESCDEPDGKHYNPTDAKHGPPSSADRHVGDFGNITAGDDGRAWLSLTTNSLTVTEGGNSSVAGKAIVVTRNADNGTSQPSGKSGPAVACGVIAIDPKADTQPLVPTTVR